MKEITLEYIRGLVDGEGCFEITVSKRAKKCVFGSQVRPEFRMTLKHIPALNEVRRFLNMGTVIKVPKREGLGMFSILSLRDLVQFRRLLREHPPLVKKREFRIWAKAIDAHRRFTTLGPFEERKVAFLEMVGLRDELNLRPKRRRITSEMIKRWMEDALASREWVREG